MKVETAANWRPNAARRGPGPPCYRECRWQLSQSTTPSNENYLGSDIWAQCVEV